MQSPFISLFSYNLSGQRQREVCSSRDAGRTPTPSFRALDLQKPPPQPLSAPFLGLASGRFGPRGPYPANTPEGRSQLHTAAARCEVR